MRSFQVFRLIMVPLATPAIITLTVLTALYSWNNFLWPLIITNSPASMTVPVAVAYLSADTAAIINYTVILAAAFFTSLPMINYLWGGVETNHVGVHEFLDFCEMVGAKPILAINFAGDGRPEYINTARGAQRAGGPEEAADLVSYCNDPDHAERRANGRAKPWQVRTWQIGNETSYPKAGERFTSAENARHYRAFADAMRARDPDILLIGWGDMERDTIVVLNQGEVQQVGTPMELYNRPANLFVAGFIGAPKMNLLPVGVVAVDGTSVTVAAPGMAATTLPLAGSGLHVGDPLTLGIRPHLLDIDPAGALSGRVRLIERLGDSTIVEVDGEAGQTVFASIDGDREVALGDAMTLGFAGGKAHLFGRDGRRLGA